MVDCVVCRYWSERLQEAGRRRRNKRESNEEKRAIAALRAHRRGACASRFPDLLKDLVKHEPETPNKSPGLCDPMQVRILAAGSRDEFGLVPVYGWQ
jgi:hypothetical protein